MYSTQLYVTIPNIHYTVIRSIKCVKHTVEQNNIKLFHNVIFYFQNLRALLKENLAVGESIIAEIEEGELTK